MDDGKDAGTPSRSTDRDKEEESEDCEMQTTLRNVQSGHCETPENLPNAPAEQCVAQTKVCNSHEEQGETQVNSPNELTEQCKTSAENIVAQPEHMHHIIPAGDQTEQHEISAENHVDQSGQYDTQAQISNALMTQTEMPLNLNVSAGCSSQGLVMGARPKCFECMQRSQVQGLGFNTPVTVNTDPNLCSVCGKSLRDQIMMFQPPRVNASMKMFHCSECPKWCRSNSDLKKHMLTHTGARPYVCGICQKSYRSSSSLCKHERSHTGDGDIAKLLQCFYCEKRFEYNCEREKHMRVHTGDRPFQCPQCQMAFSLSCNLRRHIKTHNGDITFVCEECDKNFTSKRSLTRHNKLVHSGDTSYKCPLCDMGFPCGEYLKKHLKKHAREASGIKRRKRGTVNKTNNQTIKQEKSTETKTYECPQCDEIFDHDITFSKHLEEHTKQIKHAKYEASTSPNSSDDSDPEEPREYKCYVCHLLFFNQKDVLEHLETHDVKNPPVFPEFQAIKSEESCGTAPEIANDTNS